MPARALGVLHVAQAAHEEQLSIASGKHKHCEMDLASALWSSHLSRASNALARRDLPGAVIHLQFCLAIMCMTPAFSTVCRHSCAQNHTANNWLVAEASLLRFCSVADNMATSLSKPEQEAQKRRKRTLWKDHPGLHDTRQQGLFNPEEPLPCLQVRFGHVPLKHLLCKTSLTSTLM